MSGMEVGIGVPTRPPLSAARWMLRIARLARLDSVWTVDHFLGFIPSAIWDEELTWLAGSRESPDAFFDYQALLGYLAARAGNVQLAVGVTEPIRRHPVLLAQTFLTLSHLARRPPILGIGAGERENVEPYGLQFEPAVSRLEEALQVIRLCFSSRGPVSFQGRFFRLEDALMDLQAPPGRTPRIWLAAHGPRMLRLTGRYGDGWYPTYPMSPAEYGDRLEVIRAAAREAGRDPDAITGGLSFPMVVAPTERAARRLLRAKAVRFGMLLLPSYVWEGFGHSHPLGDDFRGLVDFIPQQFDRASIEAAIASVPEDLVVEAVNWGTPRRLLERLFELREAGLRHVVLGTVTAALSRRGALFALPATWWMARRLRS